MWRDATGSKHEDADCLDLQILPAACRACIAMPAGRPEPTWCSRSHVPPLFRRRQAARGLVSVRAHLHPCQRHREGRIPQACAELGLIIVAPDTSPRRPDVPGDTNNAYDFGLGAGFYVDATEEPFARNYRMWSYVTGRICPSSVAENFPSMPSGNRSWAIRWAAMAR